MLSPLQLKQHRFTVFSVEAIATGLPEHESCVKTEAKWGHAKDNELAWRVELTVEFGPDEERAKSPYQGKANIVGFFNVAEQWPAEKREELVRINGASVLFGAVREMILAVTSRSTHGPFLIPTFSFANGEGTQSEAPKQLKQSAPRKRAASKK